MCEGRGEASPQRGQRSILMKRRGRSVGVLLRVMPEGGLLEGGYLWGVEGRVLMERGARSEGVLWVTMVVVVVSEVGLLEGDCL